MPSLQLHVAGPYPAGVKRTLAGRLAAVYAEIMAASPELVTVVVHEHGEGGVWHGTADGDAVPSALLACHVRAGRPPEVRADLARSMGSVCREVLGLDPARLKVEFTQHRGDEMYHPHLGGFNRDWDPGEATG